MSQCLKKTTFLNESKVCISLPFAFPSYTMPHVSEGACQETRLNDVQQK